GLSPQADAERVAAARKAAGPDFILAVDANRGWTAEEAIEFATLVEPLTIRWFEEPCHWYDDAAQMARVRAKTRIPVTAGQSEISSHSVRRLLDAGAVDIVNYDVSEGGGVTDWRRAAALCAAAGVQVAHHEESQIAQHLISAIPHGTYVECFADPGRDPVWQHMWLNRPPIVDGMMAVSAGPGFGLELDARMIAEYRVAWVVIRRAEAKGMGVSVAPFDGPVAAAKPRRVVGAPPATSTDRPPPSAERPQSQVPRHLRRYLALSDFEATARRRLPRMLYGF